MTAQTTPPAARTPTELANALAPSHLPVALAAGEWAPIEPATAPAPDISSRDSGGRRQPIDPDLLALVVAYPLASHVRFRTYHPVIRPRDWRRVAEHASWALQRDDLLEVTGYGATRNFPEALLTRRLQDGVEAMVFPSELFAPEQP